MCANLTPSFYKKYEFSGLMESEEMWTIDEETWLLVVKGMHH